MYGLIGKMLAVEGRRDDLAEILMNGISGMPGCLSYIVARDADDEDSLWVTEVWKSEAHHRESLALPSVRSAIEAGRPLIAGFGERYVTEPLGGHGLRDEPPPEASGRPLAEGGGPSRPGVAEHSSPGAAGQSSPETGVDPRDR